MSFSDTLIGVNSAALNTPLNHIIWLNDYKTYGENSYVFRDKNIIHELYASSTAAKDAQIYDEASAYNKSYMSKDDYIKWFKYNPDNSHASDDILKILLYKDFEQWTHDELSAVVYAHYNDEIVLSDWLKVGATRSVNLSAMEATGVGESHVAQTVQFAIADFDHDTLVTPINGHNKAAITLLQIVSLAENGYMNSSGTNSGGWNSCARRTWCNNVYYNALPSDLRSAIKTVNKLTSSGNSGGAIVTSSDKCFLLSEIETGSTAYSISGEGYKYAYYGRTTSEYGWSRSPVKSNNTHFSVINHVGPCEWFPASNAYSLNVAFCL